MEKNATVATYDVPRDQNFFLLLEKDVQSWVDGTIDDLKPRNTTKSTLCAVLCLPRLAKRDHAIKWLRKYKVAIGLHFTT
jgi:hypothetical protein